MAVHIRMQKFGRKHRPFFRIVAIDARQPRDGRAIEELGSYDPMVKDKDKRVILRAARIKYWMSVGAKLSEKVEVLWKKYRSIFEQMEAEEASGVSTVLPAPVPAPAAPSAPVSPPTAPTNLQATPGDTQVLLNWTAPTVAASYNIYRGANAAMVATTPIQTDVTGTTFADIGLTNGTSYVYSVTAVNRGGQSAHSNLASATPQMAKWGLKEAEAQIDIWLRERGFGNRRSHSDHTCWSGTSAFWHESQGDLWCLALLPGGALVFGVYAELLREAESARLGGGGTIQEFLNLARNNPDFPKPIRLIQRTFVRDGREYWGVQIGPMCGPPEVYALIAELVNAFEIRVTSPDREPWTSTGSRPGPQLGVLNERTVRMPDPEENPYHGFIIRLAEYINDQVERHGYRSVGEFRVRGTLRRYTGSFSWDGDSWGAGSGVNWKLCYHGHHDWRFGVREELVQANACLGQQRYDFRFHVPPDTIAVFHGFRVYDTLASLARIKVFSTALRMEASIEGQKVRKGAESGQRKTGTEEKTRVDVAVEHFPFVF